jgi:hypothetical protein
VHELIWAFLMSFSRILASTQRRPQKKHSKRSSSTGTSFPKTHSLSDLLTLAESAGVKLPSDVLEAARLTLYAVATRYPGLAEEVTHDEYLDAVKLATRVVQWAESLTKDDRGVS